MGVGRHHAVDDQAMRRRVGDEVVDRYRCYSPPVDDRSAYADLGKTPEGVPVRVFRPVAEADLRILVGSVLPHLQAGFGGGYKLIFPGTSHRSTLGALHRQGLDHGDAARLLGGRPVRQPDAPGDPLGRRAARSLPLDQPPDRRAGQVFRVRAGHPDSVQDVLAAEARRRFHAPDAGAADVIVAGNHPWPGDPMQSFKVLLQHRAACRGRRRARRLLLDRPGRDRPLVSAAGDAGDRWLGRVGGWVVAPGAGAGATGRCRP